MRYQVIPGSMPASVSVTLYVLVARNLHAKRLEAQLLGMLKLMSCEDLGNLQWDLFRIHWQELCLWQSWSGDSIINFGMKSGQQTR